MANVPEIVPPESGLKAPVADFSVMLDGETRTAGVRHQVDAEDLDVLELDARFVLATRVWSLQRAGGRTDLEEADLRRDGRKRSGLQLRARLVSFVAPENAPVARARLYLPVPVTAIVPEVRPFRIALPAIE